jgi:hypothetical protein
MGYGQEFHVRILTSGVAEFEEGLFSDWRGKRSVV